MSGSGSSSNDDDDDLCLTLPQLDGNDGAGEGQQFRGNQMQPGVQMAFAVNQGNSGVIPILMPPGTFGTKR